MQESFVRRMKERLLSELASAEAEHARLQSVVASTEAPSEHAGLGNHMADDATDLFEQEKNLALLQHTDRLLEKMQAALHRIEQGEYGRCVSCGEAIDEARLESLPHAALCLRCKSRQEKK